MADLLYLALTLALLAASYGLVVVCERLRENQV